MIEQIDLGSLLSSLGGGSIVVGAARLYFSRLLRELDDTVKSLVEVEKTLAIVLVKLKKIEQNDNIIRIHDRKIAKLEEKISNLKERGIDEKQYN